MLFVMGCRDWAATSHKKRTPESGFTADTCAPTPARATFPQHSHAEKPTTQRSCYTNVGRYKTTLHFKGSLAKANVVINFLPSISS